jgi:hypothetical protein
VLGVDTAGALPTGVGVERREGVNEVRTSTAHHARKVENQRIGERQFEEGACADVPRRFARAVRCWLSVRDAFCRLPE